MKEEKKKIDKMFLPQRLNYAKKILSAKEYLVLKIFLSFLDCSDGAETSIEDLRRSVIKMNKKTTKQSGWLVVLTIIIAILTLLMLFGL